MASIQSKRRMAENEVVFRKRNESIQKGFEELTRIAREDGQESLIDQKDGQLHFYCECSDENCRKRLLVKLSKYIEIHKQRNRFVVAPGHEVAYIEKIITSNKIYSIVEKFISIPSNATKLKQTPVDNT